MAEPFVFSFKPDAHRRPQVMYIADLSCACELCGHPQYQRFYHAILLHTLTLPRYLELVRTLRQKVGYECENCGEPVGAGAAEQGVVRFAFADDSGEVTSYVDYREEPAVLRHVMRPGRRLDPQVQPAFKVPEDVLVLEGLEETSFWRYLGRPLNMKQHWRDVIAQFATARAAGGPHALVETKMASHILGVASSSRKLTEALERANQSLAEAGRAMVEYRLGGAAGGRLVEADEVGSWRRWLPPSTLGQIDRGELFVGALLGVGAAEEVIERGLSVARLGWTGGGEQGVYREITTPRGEVCEEEVRVEEVMHRAVETGLTVGEAARLTLEEVVGRLMGVWEGG